jgi:hypothetical protein
MEEDSATAQSVMRGIDKAAERLGLDRPNLGLDKQLVRILLLLGSFVFLLQIRPQQPNAVQVSNAATRDPKWQLFEVWHVLEGRKCFRQGLVCCRPWPVVQCLSDLK